MNKYEFHILGTKGEVFFSVQAENIIKAWLLVDTFRSEIAYIGVPHTFNVKEVWR